MNTEIEAKFVNVSIDDVRSNLTKLGAVLEQPMRLMKRVTIDSDFMRSNNAFLRIRDEGNKITITYKQFGLLDHFFIIAGPLQDHASNIIRSGLNTKMQFF